MANDITVIHSVALSPLDGVARIARQETGYRAVGPEWPATLAVGDAVEVYGSQGWIWPAEVLSLEPGSERGKVRITGERRAQPFPAVVDGAVSLPNVSGHAHTRSWRRGDIVRLGDETLKVKSAKPTHHGSQIRYELEPVSAEQYARRPGRTRFSSADSARPAVGTAVQVGTEWLHVKKIERQVFHGALGRDYTYYGVGNFVPAAKAEKINAVQPVLLDQALMAVHGERVREAMPADAVTLLPRDTSSLAATGSRVAVVGDAVLHERAGDPDRIDSWYHYAVRITDPALVARVKAFVRAAKKGGAA